MEPGPRIGDPFGDAILSHYDHDDGGFHVVERDDGYLDVLGSRPYFAPIEDWNPGEAELIERASGTVLDFGAGSGIAGIAAAVAVGAVSVGLVFLFGPLISV